MNCWCDFPGEANKTGQALPLPRLAWDWHPCRGQGHDRHHRLSAEAAAAVRKPSYCGSLQVNTAASSGRFRKLLTHWIHLWLKLHKLSLVALIREEWLVCYTYDSIRRVDLCSKQRPTVTWFQLMWNENSMTTKFKHIDRSYCSHLKAAESLCLCLCLQCWCWENRYVHCS